MYWPSRHTVRKSSYSRCSWRSSNRRKRVGIEWVGLQEYRSNNLTCLWITTTTAKTPPTPHTSRKWFLPVSVNLDYNLRIAQHQINSVKGRETLLFCSQNFYLVSPLAGIMNETANHLQNTLNNGQHHLISAKKTQWKECASFLFLIHQHLSAGSVKEGNKWC